MLLQSSSSNQSQRTLTPQRKKEQLLMSALIIMYILQMVASAPYLWSFVGLGAAYIASQQFTWSKKHRRKFLTVLGVIAIPLMLALWAEPSHAVLLSRVQDFLTDSFGTGTDEDYTPIVNMVVNSARAIYIFFLVIAGWNAVNDSQQGQEMSGFARNMLMSLLGVFVVDVMSVIIVPATGGGGAGG